MSILDNTKIQIKNTEEFELYYRHRAIRYGSDKIFFNLGFFLESNETNTFSEENIDKHIINVIKSNLDREFFINDSAEPIPPYIKNISKFIEICKLYNKSITILTGENSDSLFNLYKSMGVNVIFLPLFNFFSYSQFSIYSSFSKENTFEKRYLTLNRASKPTRHYLYNFLKDNDLLKFGEYSFVFKDIKSFEEDINKNDNPLHTASIIDKFGFNKKCFLNFVVESVNDDYFTFNNQKIITNFASEKTNKALLTPLPFVIIGEPNALHSLKSYGIKTFSDYWDEGYDLEYDTKIRTDKAANILKTICYESDSVLREIYNDTESIHKENTSLINSILDDNIRLLKEKINL